jgi:HSP20 family protein
MLPTKLARRMELPFVTPLANVDRLFNEFFGDGGPIARSAGWTMPVAMWQDDKAVFVEMEIPGVPADDLSITVHEGRLIVSGERKRPAEGARDGGYTTRYFGRFEETVLLPPGIDPNAVEATINHGVLTVTIGLLQSVQPKKVAVKTVS